MVLIILAKRFTFLCHNKVIVSLTDPTLRHLRGDTLNTVVDMVGQRFPVTEILKSDMPVVRGEDWLGSIKIRTVRWKSLQSMSTAFEGVFYGLRCLTTRVVHDKDARTSEFWDHFFKKKSFE
jgi:hypothetical protein